MRARKGEPGGENGRRGGYAILPGVETVEKNLAIDRNEKEIGKKRESFDKSTTTYNARSRERREDEGRVEGRLSERKHARLHASSPLTSRARRWRTTARC